MAQQAKAKEDPNIYMIEAKIYQVTDIADQDPGPGISDAYCVVEINGQSVAQTNVEWDKHRAEWNFEFRHFAWKLPKQFEIKVYDCDGDSSFRGGDDYIGKYQKDIEEKGMCISSVCL